MGWGQISLIAFVVVAGAVGVLYIFVPDAHQQACDYVTGPVGQNIYINGGPLAEIIKYPIAICGSLGLAG